MGLKDDETKAGYIPANTLPKTISSTSPKRKAGLEKSDKVDCPPMKGEIYGFSNNKILQEILNARRFITSDSVKNCLISCDLPDPITLRIPTSLDLSNEREMDKLIKLIQAISITKIAIAKSA
jgi:hypothetical protein